MRKYLFRGRIIDMKNSIHASDCGVHNMPALPNTNCDCGLWVYGHYTEGSPNYHYITKPDGSVWQVIPESVGQFTGLTDKNGKDIFEGDIIGWTTFFRDSDIPTPDKKASIEFDMQSARFIGKCLLNGKTYTKELIADFGDGSGFAMQSIEVIGNTYDNPELLK